MPKFRFIDQTPSLDGTVTVVHIMYGYTYEFYIKADRSGLGAVEIHRELMTAAARWMAALKLESVLSARIAIRLNSFSLPKKFSIR
jgi:hypothetical protein